MLTVKQRNDLLTLVADLRESAFETARVMYHTIHPDPTKVRAANDTETAAAVALAHWISDHTDTSIRPNTGSEVAS